MNPNTNRWNRIRYGLYAPFYDQMVGRLDRGRRRSIAELNLQSGERLLIPGCGTGLDFEHLPPGVRITAGDLSPAMTSKARRRADHLGLDAEVRVMNAQKLELPDASFEVALLHLILAVVPDPEAAIRETARVLVPGGRIGVFDKFLPDGARPSLLRRAASAVANALVTDLNRQLGPLAQGAGLVVESDEPALFGGLFRVAELRKPPVSH
jgi:ubiquinone/menaquinone biosynthesis C-methylase UbiE